MCERSKKIEVEDIIQKTDGKDEETVLGLPGAVRSLRIFEEVGGGFVRWICNVGRGAQVENLLFFCFFCASVDVGRFLLLNNTLQTWDPPTFRGFFGLIFPMKRIFEPTVLLLKKGMRCHPFLAVVHLWVKNVEFLQ